MTPAVLLRILSYLIAGPSTPPARKRRDSLRDGGNVVYTTAEWSPAQRRRDFGPQEKWTSTIGGCVAASVFHDRGVEQLVARRAHNPKVVGSSPTPATTQNGEWGTEN